MTRHSLLQFRLQAGLLAGFGLAAAGPSVFSQGPPPPSAVTSQAPVVQTGTGLIVGQVIDGSSGRPVPGAIVTLGGSVTSMTTMQGPGVVSGRGNVQMTATGSVVTFSSGLVSTTPRLIADSEGRFAFRQLPRGNYFLNVNKPGYLDGSYGRLRPNGPSQSIILDEGERKGDANVRLFKYASISGTVTDDSGDAVVGVQVRAFRRSLVGGRRTISASGPSTQTDDRGAYRLGTLSPGEYIVAVPFAPQSVPANLRGSNADIQATMMSPGSMGMFFGGPGTQVGNDMRFVLQTGGRDNAAITDGSGRLKIYPTHYHPSAMFMSQAQSITIDSGEDRSGVDVLLKSVPTASIAGMLVGPGGPAPNYVLHLVPSDSGEMSFDPDVATAVTDTDGFFTFLGVPAGQYIVQTVRVPRQGAPPPPPPPPPPPGAGVAGGLVGTLVSGRGSGRGTVKPEPVLWAAMPISVGGEDFAGLTVVLHEGLKLSGRVEWEGSAERPPAARLMQTTVMVEAVDGKQRATNTQPARLDEQGQFTVDGLVPGKYVLRVNNIAGGWYLKTAMHGGNDISDVAFEVEDKNISGVTVTFYDRTTQVRGTVRNSQGAPSATAAVVMFPADSQLWANQGGNPRRMRMTRASTTGTFGFSGMPPGDYWMIAISEEFAGEWQEPRFLEALSRAATRFTLGEGEMRSQDLVIANVKAGGEEQEEKEEEEKEKIDTGHGPFVDDDQVAVAPQVQMPRDIAVDIKSGSASISGIVLVDVQSKQPVRRARVSIRGQGPDTRVAMTDEAGRFTVPSLPPGRYTITVTKAAYLTAYYGAKRPGTGPPLPLDITVGQKHTDLVVLMPRGSVITGSVLDEFGQPVSNVSGRVMQYRMLNGERRLVQTGGSGQMQTDDRGVYRIYGLIPGAYLIATSPPNMFGVNEIRQLSTDEMQSAMAELSRPAPPPPRTTSSLPATSTMMPGAPAQPGLPPQPGLPSRGGAPAAPGRGATPAPAGAGPQVVRPPAPAMIDPGGRAVGYAPFYYPGTPLVTQAGTVTVELGQEVTGIDIPLRLVPVATVEGTITSVDGQPVTALQVMATPVGPIPMQGPGMPSARTTPDGKFTMANVPPGRYAITARGRPQSDQELALQATLQAARAEAAARGGPPPPPPPPTPSPAQVPHLWAMEEIDVAGVKVTGLALQLRPGMTVTGRFVHAGKTLSPPTDLKQLRVSMAPLATGPMMFSPPPAKIDDTGKFVIEGVVPGRYRLNASSPIPMQAPPKPGEFPTTWMVKSATINGRDILDSSLEVRANENIEGVVVTFTDQYTELTGTLLDPAGAPAPGFYIAVFTTDRTAWAGTSRRVRSTFSTDGKFRMTGLPPGEYYLAALTDLDPNVWGEPEFLEAVAAGAIKITLAEAEKKTQDMRISR